jgi:Fe-S-cluster-containing hydrogenase component 2
MANKKTDVIKITRREFVAGAGTVIALGAVSGLAACAPAATQKAGQATREGPSGSALILHDPNVCAGCGVCSLMCGFSHEKEYGHSLARNELVRDPFNAAYTFHVCRQCASPACYAACPKKDSALCIDEAGVKYVNVAKCVGCGSCSGACPFTPPRVNVHPVKKVAFKCDLCRDRDNGPICVEYCTMHALRKASARGRE